MDVASSAGSSNIMGQLRSMIEKKHGRKRFSGYKKRFWVVNFHTKRLEVYKNDQSHEPANQWRAEDIRGVIYAGDKQNKFYAMIVQTRLGQTIKFRMSSLEEREKWSRAITQLIDAFSMSHRRNNIFEFLQRHTRSVGRNLNVNITVDWPRLLTAPQEMLEYTVEALDNALANVSVLVRDYGTEFKVPRMYTLNVETLEGSPASLESFPGPQYDPVKRSAVLNVVLYKDGLDHVKFFVTSPEEVIAIMQSNVFRNPLIEGWIDTSPGCAEVCEEIRSLLGMSAAQLPITFQWGQHLSDSDRVETYLQKFVNESFFRGVLMAVRDTLRDVEGILADLLLAPVSSHPSPATTPRTTAANAGGGGGGTNSPGQTLPRGFSNQAAHSRSFSAALFLSTGDLSGLGGGSANKDVGSQPNTARGTARDRDRNSGVEAFMANLHGTNANSSLYGNPNSGAAAMLSAAAMSDLRASAVRLLADNLTGLAIQLDKRVVDEGRRPPLVSVEHTMDYEAHSRPAFLLVAKYGQIYGQVRKREASHLRDQLFEVAFHALLSKQISSLRNRLHGVFGGKVKVAIMWDRLLQVFHKLDATLFMRDLPKLVNALADVYLPRMLHTVQLMASVRANPRAVSSAGHVNISRTRASSSGGTAGAHGVADSHSTTAAVPASATTAGGITLAAGGTTTTTATANSAGGGGTEPIMEESELTVLDVFTHCVGGVVIDFLSYPDLIEAQGGNAQKPTMALAAQALPEPTLVNGTLTDAILCADEATMTAMVNTVNQLRDASSRRAPLLLRSVYAYAATPRMGNWCEKYFSAPERVAACMASPHKVIEDEFASESDAGTADQPPDLGTGEAVANERRAEISVLNMKRVVNTIYDSQGDSIDLKISAQEIITAIRSLQKAFRPRKVTKHDIMRVLTMNLRQLRSMYSLAMDGEANTFLSEATAKRLLCDFCEFKETEDYVEPALQRSSGGCSRTKANSFVNPAVVQDVDGVNLQAAFDANSAEPSTAPQDAKTTQEPGQAEGSISNTGDSQSPDHTVPPHRRMTLQPSNVSHTSSPSPTVSMTTAKAPTAQPRPNGESIDSPLRLEQTNLFPNAAAGPDGSGDGARGGLKKSGGPLNDSSNPNSGTTANGSAGNAHEPSGGGRDGGDKPGGSAARAGSPRRRFSEPFRSRRLQVTTSAEPFTEAEESGEAFYDFQTFSSIALNELLPHEAVIARRAWRTGFVFGLENAGKSQVLNSIRGFPRPTVATVGLSRQVVAFDEWVLSLNELGGRDSFRKNWIFYAKRMEEVHFLLHVVDCSSMSLYDESIRYLREVVGHFRDIPMVIVFNNYQSTPMPKDMKKLAWEYEVDKIQRLNPKRSIFMCTHELCPVHPICKPTPMPENLRATMRELADVLYEDTPEHEKPTVPKDAQRNRALNAAASSVGGASTGAGHT